jgi:purine nucleoside permease
LEGDDLAADTFWIGDLLNTWAENWVSYWTVNQGSFAVADFEDAAVGQALQFLSQAGRADQNRLLVLRSASDYTIQPQGQIPAQFLASENAGGLSGFQEALNDVYDIGSVVVKKLSSHWAHTRSKFPLHLRNMMVTADKEVSKLHTWRKSQRRRPVRSVACFSLAASGRACGKFCTR